MNTEQMRIIREASGNARSLEEMMLTSDHVTRLKELEIDDVIDRCEQIIKCMRTCFNLDEKYYGRIRLRDRDGSATDKNNQYIEWIGPITEDEMRSYHTEYRHNVSDSLPTTGALVLGVL